jgi:hypothetical protein
MKTFEIFDVILYFICSNRVISNNLIAKLNIYYLFIKNKIVQVRVV